MLIINNDQFHRVWDRPALVEVVDDYGCVILDVESEHTVVALVFDLTNRDDPDQPIRRRAIRLTPAQCVELGHALIRSGTIGAVDRPPFTPEPF